MGLNPGALLALIAEQYETICALRERVARLEAEVTAARANAAPAPSAWKTGETVQAGDQRTYGGAVYQVIQAHATQTGWEPPATPALWKQV